METVASDMTMTIAFLIGFLLGAILAGLLKETWWGWGHFEKTGGTTATGKPEMTFVWDQDYETLAYFADCPDGPGHEPFRASPDTRDRWHKRPSIFMPRWASRITLEITGVEVKPLWRMTVNDMLAEGVPEPPEDEGVHELTPFIRLWDSINARRGLPWQANPWVWCIEFQRVEA